MQILKFTVEDMKCEKAVPVEGLRIQMELL